MDPIVTLNGFTLNPPASDGTGYELDEDGLQGWYGSPSPVTTYTKRIADPGSWFDPLAYEGPRPIVLQGELIMADQVSLELEKLRLSSICPDPSQLYPLTVVDAFGTLIANVQRSDAVLFKPASNNSSAFSLSVTAPDPYKYDPTMPPGGNTTLAITLGGLDWSTGGGLDWATSGGLNWGIIGSDGTFVLSQSGLAPSWPLFTIVGPTDAGQLTNVVITCTDTGQRITYSGLLNVNDTVVIDTNPATRSATLNGSTDVWNGLSQTEWFPVPAGGQVRVQFEASTGSATPQLFGVAPNAYF